LLNGSEHTTCPCGNPRQDGHHITFVCSRFRKERRELVGLATTWEQLDAPMWAKEGGDEPYDRVEAFFGFLFTKLG